jgi:SAM-dependent methyltransferase
MDAGRRCYEPLAAAIEQHHRRQPERRTRLLDFGCGVGRVLQYFPREEYDLCATDVDGSAIAYLQRAFPWVHSGVSQFAPPLQYDDGRFDVVYSVSIWTHLAPALQIPWLLEVKRILSPGGLALLTTIGPHGYRVGSHTWGVSFSLEELLRDGYCYTEYAGKDDSVGPSYGAGYHTPDYVRKEWSRFFDVLDVREGVVDGLNDLVILRKTS